LLSYIVKKLPIHSLYYQILFFFDELRSVVQFVTFSIATVQKKFQQFFSSISFWTVVLTSRFEQSFWTVIWTVAWTVVWTVVCTVSIDGCLFYFWKVVQSSSSCLVMKVRLGKVRLGCVWLCWVRSGGFGLSDWT